MSSPTGTVSDSAAPKLVRRLAHAGVAILAAMVAGSMLVAAWASWRGLDLTDEGIYLHTYRAWRDPRLTITGSSVVLGPIFQLLGWSIPALRLLKLVAVVGAAAFLGDACFRFVDHARPLGDLRREKRALLVLGTVMGALSIYSWIPLTPGYNDITVVLSMVISSLILRWSVSESARGKDAAAVGLGLAWLALFFTKWPSAVCVAGGVAVFAIALHGMAVLRLIGGIVGGIVVGVVAVQLIAGDVVGRVRLLGSSGSTQLEGSSVVDLYVRPYLDNLVDVANAVVRIAVVSAVVPVVVALVLRRRSPRVAAVVLSMAPLLTLFRARQTAYLLGGSSNVERVAASLPILVVCVLIVAAVLAWWSRTERPASERRTGLRVGAGVLLVLAMPSLQALGTGNPFFQIASIAGGLWAAGALTGLLVASRSNNGVALLPAAAAVATLSIAVLVLGIQGLWTEGFRMGPIRNQSLPIRGVPAVNGLRVDAGNRELIERTAEVLEKNGFTGKPGFSAGVGTGLTYALGMPAPLAGIFIEEPLPAPLRSRLREACRLKILTPTQPPVVLGRGDDFPKVTAEELRRCGIDFPNSYRSERVKPATAGTGPMGDVGVTVWMPNTSAATAATTG